MRGAHLVRCEPPPEARLSGEPAELRADRSTSPRPVAGWAVDDAKGSSRAADAAFWISPPLLAPLFILMGDRYEQPINALPGWKLRALSGALLALASAGGLIAAIRATDTAYLLGAMLGTPVVMLLVRRNEEQHIDPVQASSESFGGPLGLP